MIQWLSGGINTLDVGASTFFLELDLSLLDEAALRSNDFEYSSPDKSSLFIYITSFSSSFSANLYNILFSLILNPELILSFGLSEYSFLAFSEYSYFVLYEFSIIEP